jgi:hypothetical protein
MMPHQQALNLRDWSMLRLGMHLHLAQRPSTDLKWASSHPKDADAAEGQSQQARNCLQPVQCKAGLPL